MTEEEIIKQGVAMLGHFISQDIANKGATMIRELLKHAQIDNCQECAEILRAMGIDCEKSFEQLVKEAKAMFGEIVS